MTNNLTSMIRELSFFFAKYHYDEYLKENKIHVIKDDKIAIVVEKLYTEEKKKELREYIRTCLKETLAENYNSFAIENVLMEMFTDIELSKNRIIMEIKSYQDDKIANMQQS